MITAIKITDRTEEKVMLPEELKTFIAVVDKKAYRCLCGGNWK